MGVPGIGELTAADEGLDHQIVDTFATLSQSDRSWTEKIWGSFARTDGTLQVDFGLGRYSNRGVVDAFGGVSRQREQWTVRASRELMPDRDTLGAGPVRYEVITPLEAVRCVLEPNDVLDMSFDITFTGTIRPFLEERNSWRAQTGRIQSDVIRYHQGGTVQGWLSLGGERIQIVPEEWFGFRDHSWGVRGDSVGELPTDIAPSALSGLADGSELPTLMHWTPWLLTRPDGSSYEVHFLVSDIAGFRMIDSAYINHSDGRQERVRRVHPRLEYDTVTRYLLGGAVDLEMLSGEILTFEVEALGESGFFLRTAGYGGWKDAKHGVWHGPLFVDGEVIEDCSEPGVRRQLGQFRDRPVRVTAPDAAGYGIFETIMTGVWPDLGLTAESNHGGY